MRPPQHLSPNARASFYKKNMRLHHLTIISSAVSSCHQFACFCRRSWGPDHSPRSSHTPTTVDLCCLGRINWGPQTLPPAPRPCDLRPATCMGGRRRRFPDVSGVTKRGETGARYVTVLCGARFQRASSMSVVSDSRVKMSEDATKLW